MKFSSSNVSPEANSSICTDQASAQTDMEGTDNPFRNLHPKIYHRQKNAPSRKVIKDNKSELSVDIKSSPLGSVNVKTDHSSKHSNSSWLLMKTDDYSVISEKTVREKEHDDYVEGRFSRETYLRNQNTVAYLNERNIYLSKDVPKGEKLTLPLIVSPRTARENELLINTSFAPSSKSNKGLHFPPIKDVPSFIPLVHEEEKKKGKRWHKKVRDTHAVRLGKQVDEYWWNTYTPAYPAVQSTRQDLANQTIQPKYCQGRGFLLESATKKKGRSSQGVYKATNFRSTNAEDFYSRKLVASQTLSARTYSNYNDTSEEMSRDYMILKAKIHRSSFI